MLIFIRKAHSYEVDTNEFTNALKLRINALAGLSHLGIPEEIIENAKTYMNSFPKTNTFLHGDINTGNVMLKDDELVFIDMGTAGYGHPYIDLAVDYLFFVFADENIQNARTGLTTKEAAELLDIFLKQYFQTENQEIIEKYKIEILPLVRITKLLSTFVVPNVTPEQLQEYKDQVVEVLKNPPEITYLA